jgi:hypothetical protein
VPLFSGDGDIASAKLNADSDDVVSGWEKSEELLVTQTHARSLTSPTTPRSGLKSWWAFVAIARPRRATSVRATATNEK